MCKYKSCKFNSHNYVIFNYNAYNSIDYYLHNNKKKVLIYCGPSHNSLSNHSISNKLNNIKHIIVIDSIKEKIKKEFKINKKYIGIHFRNTDIKTDKNLLLNNIKNKINDNNIKLLYLGTDDCNMYDYLKENLNNIEILRITIPKCNIYNLHYSLENKYESVYNCLVDIYYLLNSDIFIPSIKSSLSRWILKMRNNNNLNIFR